MTDADATRLDDADVVIAGGGSTGCVIASRLSEDPSLRVVLLEAGGPSDRFLVTMPTGSYLMLGKPANDWMYMTEPDPSLNGRRVMWTAGRMLGGSSAINGMVYIRGARSDYDAWERDLGCTGWGWRDVDRYFRRSEHYAGRRRRRIPASGRSASRRRAPITRSRGPSSRRVPSAGWLRLRITAAATSKARSPAWLPSATASGRARRAPSRVRR